VDLKRVTNEAHLTDDLNLDWLDQLELMVLIEDEFVGVDFFANTAASQIELVGDIIRHIEDRGTAPARRSAAQLVIPARTIVARAATYFLLSQDALIFLF